MDDAKADIGKKNGETLDAYNKILVGHGDEEGLMSDVPGVGIRRQDSDIPADDAEELFNLLDTDGGGTLTINELISGMTNFPSSGAADSQHFSRRISE